MPLERFRWPFCFRLWDHGDLIIVCVVIWLVYSLAPETARRGVKELPENNLEQWNAELQRLLLQ